MSQTVTNKILGSFRFEDITSKNLTCLQKLLFERNETLFQYTEWKYGKKSPKGFRGVIAYKENEPVGCFGVVPKTLSILGKEISCGWFADWYVIPKMQGVGLGIALLEEITQKGYPLLFGHPSPKTASNLCLQNGWTPISFQSSRRYIISPYSYFRKRTHYFIKLVFQLLRNQVQTNKSKLLVRSLKDVAANNTMSFFVNQNLDWICNQPVNSKITRTYNTWVGKKVIVKYFDDVFLGGETRRRIVLIENIRECPDDIFSFFSYTRSAKVNYLEAFTTDPFTDFVLEKAGAPKFTERPVIYFGSGYEIKKTFIQGVDRESWFYLAGSR